MVSGLSSSAVAERRIRGASVAKKPVYPWRQYAARDLGILLLLQTWSAPVRASALVNPGVPAATEVVVPLQDGGRAPEVQGKAPGVGTTGRRQQPILPMAKLGELLRLRLGNQMPWLRVRMEVLTREPPGNPGLEQYAQGIADRLAAINGTVPPVVKLTRVPDFPGVVSYLPDGIVMAEDYARGLFDSADSDAQRLHEFAWLIGHEMSHLLRFDQLSAGESTLARMRARAQELFADEVGLAFTMAVGGSGADARRVLEFTAARLQIRELGGWRHFLLADHPHMAQRIAHLMGQAARIAGRLGRSDRVVFLRSP